MKLFEPIIIKNVTFKNRIMFPPLTTGYEERDGSIGEQSLNFYKRIAEGGTGYIVIGDVAPINTFAPTPKLFHDGQIESFKKLADAVHEFGAKLGLQLFHPEYNVDALIELFKKGDASEIRAKLHHDMENYVQEVTEEELLAIIDKYAACAKRAAIAGVDVIEIHGDRLVGALCSTILNKRTDSYGGCFENRVKFALKLVETIKEAAPDLLIEYKLSIVSEIVGKDEMRGKGGVCIEEGIKLAKLLEEAGVDMLHVAQANHTGNMGDTIPAMGTQPYGFFEKYSKQIKEVVSIPVSTVGRILNPDYAQAMLDSGSCDMIGIGRGLLSDPDWVNKAQAGNASHIRQCIMCNKGCTDAIQNRQFVSCVLNAENGYEYKKSISASESPKKVVIIGAGPAGLEAARVAAAKGHKVTLFEKSLKIGGQLNIASVPPRKSEMLRALNYLMNEVSTLGVDIRLGKSPTSNDILALETDHVIIAAGAENRIIPVEGFEGKNVLNAWKVLSSEEICHGNVVVIGGGLVGAETAELLASRGCKVSIIEMLDTIAKDESTSIRPTLLEEFDKYSVDIYAKHTVTKITPNAVFCKNESSEEIEIPCNFAVMAVGAMPVSFDTVALDNAHIPYTFIGDAMQRASDLKNAITTAYDAANAI
ncbi:NAD(P)/FAD-dependent oxidoreductase [Clostridium sp. CS001]|uniref:bilirubin reductase, long form n=1 Tax=Clostridium sp. CS001 TaxID=2880648 RepID=UPI001CF243F1|nr:bilirubin reductase, long form [Clostridium sp. CS001]MCB2289087.1 NAD(P)/FAD-dependent oxidoreductase [Clostridium sp. CS001]